MFDFSDNAQAVINAGGPDHLDEEANSELYNFAMNLTDGDGFYYAVSYGNGPQFVKSLFKNEEDYKKFEEALEIVNAVEDMLNQVAFEV